MKSGANGNPSTIVKDVKVNFDEFEFYPGNKRAITDCSFVQDNKRNILILAAATDNNIALIDLDSDDLSMRKLNLTHVISEESTAGNVRHVEWAVRTNTVWVDGNDAEEMYIIDIPGDIHSARLQHTMKGMSSGNMIFVKSQEFFHTESE